MTEAQIMDTEKRIGFIGIVLGDRSAAREVNAILSQYAGVVRARVGVPDADTPAAVIGLIVEGGDQALGSLTAKLGNLPGVEVKSALTKKKATAGPEPDEERD
jgi:putative iron-only hydrogenase system regulator